MFRSPPSKDGGFGSALFSVVAYTLERPFASMMGAGLLLMIGSLVKQDSWMLSAGVLLASVGGTLMYLQGKFINENWRTFYETLTEGWEMIAGSLMYLIFIAQVLLFCMLAVKTTKQIEQRLNPPAVETKQ